MPRFNYPVNLILYPGFSLLYPLSALSMRYAVSGISAPALSQIKFLNSNPLWHRKKFQNS